MSPFGFQRGGGVGSRSQLGRPAQSGDADAVMGEGRKPKATRLIPLIKVVDGFAEPVGDEGLMPAGDFLD